MLSHIIHNIRILRISLDGAVVSGNCIEMSWSGYSKQAISQEINFNTALYIVFLVSMVISYCSCEATQFKLITCLHILHNDTVS